MSGRAKRRKSLTAQIREYHVGHHASYGSTRVFQELRACGDKVNEKTVATVMREAGIQAKSQRKFRVTTTDSNHTQPVAENALRGRGRQRIYPAGEVFHVLNRAVARLTIFEKPADYDAFLRVLDETWQVVPLPIFAMVAMPNHWHFIVRPTSDDQVSEFFRRLSVMHTMRYHAYYKTSGTGHLYQGRFKSFPIQDDEHLLTAMRYVERNPVRANFVELAETWQWGSAYARQQSADQRRWLANPSDPPLPRQWRSWVNKPVTDAEVNALRACIQRGLPFGDDRWLKSSTVRLSLESTTRPRGRPKNET